MSRAAGRAVSRLEAESGSPVAGWGDTEHAVVLYQTSSYGAAFRLIVTDTRLEEGVRIVTFASGMVAKELIVDVDDSWRRLV